MSKAVPQHVTITIDRHLQSDMVAIIATWNQGGEHMFLKSVLMGQSFLEIGPQSVAVIVHRILEEYAKGDTSSEENQKLI